MLPARVPLTNYESNGDDRLIDGCWNWNVCAYSCSRLRIVFAEFTPKESWIFNCSKLVFICPCYLREFVLPIMCPMAMTDWYMDAGTGMSVRIAAPGSALCLLNSLRRNHEFSTTANWFFICPCYLRQLLWSIASPMAMTDEYMAARAGMSVCIAAPGCALCLLNWHWRILNFHNLDFHFSNVTCVRSVGEVRAHGRWATARWLLELECLCV